MTDVFAHCNFVCNAATFPQRLDVNRPDTQFWAPCERAKRICHEKGTHFPAMQINELWRMRSWDTWEVTQLCFQQGYSLWSSGPTGAHAKTRANAQIVRWVCTKECAAPPPPTPTTPDNPLVSWPQIRRQTAAVLKPYGDDHRVQHESIVFLVVVFRLLWMIFSLRHWGQSLAQNSKLHTSTHQ